MRGFLIFGAVAFLLLFAFGYTPSRYHQQTECAKVSQTDVFDAGVLAASDQGSKEANEKSAEEYQDKRDFAAACSDLAAQWNVADVTRRAFWIGMVGLGALIMTLLYTRDASNAAKQTLNLAEIASSLEQRAYVDVGKIGYGGSIGGNEVVATFNPIIVNGFANINVTIRIRNSGNMPASNLVLTFRGKASFMGQGVLDGGDYGEFKTSNLGYLGPRSHQDISTNVNSPIYGVATPDAHGNVMALITIHTIIIFQDEYGERTGQGLKGIEQRWVGVNVTGKSFVARRANMVNQENNDNA